MRTLAAPDVTAEISRWLGYLGAERRMSPKTLEAYQRDVGQFLDFLAGHLGGAPTLRQLAKLSPADVRAFMAARRGDGLSSRSLMRGLAGARSFARFLERNGKGKVGALSAVRAPKVGKTLPKPLPIAAAKRIADTGLRAGEEREPWIIARDTAVLGLLYGSGLRISEALSLKPKDLVAGDAITVTGKGNKTRMVPVLPQVAKLITDYVALCPLDLPDDGALFVCAARSACPTRRRRTPCAIPSPPTCWRAAATCALSRSCSGTHRCRPHKSIRQLIPSVYSRFTRARIRARNIIAAIRIQ